MEGKEVVGLLNLRGGMTLKGQPGIGLRHAMSVVNDLYGGAARINDDDADALCAGIDGVLHQFLDDRSRSLDYLTGGNLIGHRVGKQLNNVTHEAERYLVSLASVLVPRAVSQASAPVRPSSHAIKKCRTC